MKIPFIILKIDYRKYMYNYKRGFTLIEVLIALAIIGFTALPLSAGMINSAKSANYARDVYKAALYANNLLMDIEGKLRRGLVIDYSSGGLDVLIDNFHLEYETEFYDYIFIIERIEPRERAQRLELKTNHLLESEIQSTQTSGIPEHLTAEYSSANEVIEWDGGFSVVSGENSSFNGDSILIEIPEGAGNTIIDLYIMAPEDITVYLNNDSVNSVFLRIFYENVYPENVNVRFGGHGSVPAAGFYKRSSSSSYILFAEVWDKKGRSLIYKAKPVII